MTETYFAFGSTLANMVNIETLSGGLPPDFLPDRGGMPIPLMGAVARQILSGRVIRQANINGAMVFDAFQDGHATLNGLLYAMYGNLTTASKQFYFSAPDSSGSFSPFQGYIVNTYLGQTAKEGVSGIPFDLVFPLVSCVLQSVTKTADYTQTSSDRLIYVDTTAGDVTITLPAASSPNANTGFSLVKIASANTMKYKRGGTDTLNGGTATLTATALGARVNYISDHVSAWVTI